MILSQLGCLEFFSTSWPQQRRYLHDKHVEGMTMTKEMLSPTFVARQVNRQIALQRKCKVSGETIEVATFDLATNDEERLLQALKSYKIGFGMKPKIIRETRTNTRDRFELRVHKHVIGLFCSPDVVKQITSITIEADVEGKGQRY
ncbi:hypothetical protein HID58_058742 [Brassica napus]|uniref:Uncharacterized protein n=1 Tax=Brassica napus TaxID=3708 RepID=A0ABQ7ZQX1_BRANA|nr:hypothetical protein HID58_058742 [Brassica napus]